MSQPLHILHRCRRVYPNRRGDLFISFPFRSRGAHCSINFDLPTLALQIVFLFVPFFFSMVNRTLKMLVSFKNRMRVVLPFHCFSRLERPLWKMLLLHCALPVSSHDSFTTSSTGCPVVQMLVGMDSVQTASEIDIPMGILGSTFLQTSMLQCTINRMICKLRWNAL